MLSQSGSKILILLSVLTLSFEKEVFIDYTGDKVYEEIFAYFYDVEDGYYLDIGAYDGVFASNTLNLYTQGWTGINVDASPQRVAHLNAQRELDTNIFCAVGEEDTFMTLYDMSDDSTSTVMNKVKEFQLDVKKRSVRQEIKVPSMSMKQICERFLQKRPLFFTLDVEGFGYKVLEGNDWENPKCRPEIIFSEKNLLSSSSGLPDPRKLLLSKGYELMPKMASANQVFILKELVNKYKEKSLKGARILKNKRITKIFPLAKDLGEYFNVTTTFIRHYSPFNDPIYYHFCRPDPYIVVS